MHLWKDKKKQCSYTVSRTKDCCAFENRMTIPFLFYYFFYFLIHTHTHTCITCPLLSIPPSKSSQILLLSFKSLATFSLSLHTYNYNLIIPYNVTFMHVFRSNPLLLDIQFVCSSLVKTISHAQHSLVAYSSLCSFEASGLSPL